jgi:flavodoxin
MSGKFLDANETKTPYIGLLPMEIFSMNNILIIYYSLFQNTKYFALEIAKQTGGTVRELVPQKNYSFDYNTAAKEVRNQISRGFCPELISGNESIDDFQTIFIGTPNWFKTVAPPVMSFLKKHDFTGKVVIPFCTHGGGGFCQIENDIAKACPKSTMLSGIAVNGTVDPEIVKNWLEMIGYE